MKAGRSWRRERGESFATWHRSADTAEERARCGLPKNLRRKGAAGSASIQMKAPPNKTHSSSSRPAGHCGAWLGSGDRRCLGFVNVRACGGWVEAGADLGSCACRVTWRERGFTRHPPPCRGPAIGASEDPTILFVLTRRGSIAGHWRRGARYLWRLGRQRNHDVDLEQPLPQGPAERRCHPEHGQPTLDGDRHRLHLFARFSRRQPRQQLRLVVAVRLEQRGLNQRICGGEAWRRTRGGGEGGGGQLGALTAWVSRWAQSASAAMRALLLACGTLPPSPSHAMPTRPSPPMCSLPHTRDHPCPTPCPLPRSILHTPASSSLTADATETVGSPASRSARCLSSAGIRCQSISNPP